MAYLLQQVPPPCLSVCPPVSPFVHLSPSYTLSLYRPQCVTYQINIWYNIFTSCKEVEVIYCLSVHLWSFVSAPQWLQFCVMIISSRGPWPWSLAQEGRLALNMQEKLLEYHASFGVHSVSPVVLNRFFSYWHRWSLTWKDVLHIMIFHHDPYLQGHLTVTLQLKLLNVAHHVMSGLQHPQVVACSFLFIQCWICYKTAKCTT